MAGKTPKAVKSASLQNALPPQSARGVVVALVCFATVAVVDVVARGRSEPTLLALSLACVGALFAVQYLHTGPNVRRWSSRRRVASLAFQALLTYIPLVGFGMGWGGIGGPLAGSVLLLLTGRIAWVLFALIAVSFVFLSAVDGLSMVPAVSFALSTILTGLVIYGLVRLGDLVGEVRATQEQVVATAVEQERLRFARDLHDLLGYSLSAIALKGEVAHRLLPDDPLRAREEVAGTLEVVRQSLADIRVVSRGYRELSLAAEARAVCGVLTAAGIDSRITMRDLSLPTEISSTLATVLREGVTNVLRHSSVRMCSISFRINGGWGFLEIINDGLDSTLPPPSGNGGCGLPNLRERLADIGGRLEAGRCGEGTYRLRAAVPLDVDPGRDEPRTLATASP